MLKPIECLGCPLEKLSNGFTMPEGTGSNGVYIVGEAAGYEEYLDGLPFRPHAASGSKLEEAFRLVEKETLRPCSRQQFRLYNIVQCNPFGNELRGASYEEAAIKHCKVHLDRVIPPNSGAIPVPVVLALGNIATRELTGYSGVAEEKESVSHLRGYVIPSKYGLVIPSYHPSFIRRNNSHLTPLLVEDLKKAMSVARGEYTSYKDHKGYIPPRYQETPGLDEAKSFYYRVKDNPRMVLSYDIETSESATVDEDERDPLCKTDILTVQFSLSKLTGINLPYNTYGTVIRDLLALPGVKAGHNVWNFDNPILEAKGIKITGPIHDTMWMFKHYHPGLPRGLQAVSSLFDFPFPWKHLFSSSFEFYGCADVDSVHWILNRLPRLMKERGVWEGYKRHVLGLQPILVRASRDVGIPVNLEKHTQLAKEFTEIRVQKNKEIQEIIPDEIRNIKPRRKLADGTVEYGYVKEPKIVATESDNYVELARGFRERFGKEPKVSFDSFLYRKHGICLARFRDDSRLDGEVSRWCKLEEFKASNQQLARYLRWKQEQVQKEAEQVRTDAEALKGDDKKAAISRARELRELAEDYEVPKHIKTKRDSTGKAELEEIFYKTGDPLIELVMQIRSLDTNLNNFLPNWLPGHDGRVHTTFGYGAPTGQLDSRQPNILNCSKHTEYGQMFRGIIEAPEGYVFCEFDKKSFHVGTMGYCANDRDYIRYSQIDPHSILGSYIDTNIIGQSISLKLSDSDIKNLAKEFKQRCKEAGKQEHGVDVRQKLAKPTVLGNQLGLGPKKLQRQNQRYIKSVKQAEELQSIVQNMFPKVEAYKRWCQEKAHRDHYFINEFGRIQYFYDVFQFRWNKKGQCWQRSEGGGARHPIAFRVQGCAFGMITEELLSCERLGYCARYNFVNSIHDSLMFMPHVRDLDSCIADIYAVMQSPCPQLVNEATGPEGLRIGVEVSVGRNWKEYDSETNKDGMKEIKI